MSSKPIAIIVNSDDESGEVQTELFRRGYRWASVEQRYLNISNYPHYIVFGTNETMLLTHGYLERIPKNNCRFIFAVEFLKEI